MSEVLFMQYQQKCSSILLIPLSRTFVTNMSVTTSSQVVDSNISSMFVSLVEAVRARLRGKRLVRELARRDL